MSYRMLIPNEVIKVGDQFKRTDGTWVTLEGSDLAGFSYCIGKHDLPTRRPIECVCLCGSTRFKDHFEKIHKSETLNGKIVLVPAFYGKSGDNVPDDMQTFLFNLHLSKIDFCDEILVININGYIGESTELEIIYAKEKGKKIRYYECAGNW